MSRILVVEHDAAVIEQVRSRLGVLGHEIVVVSDAASALSQIEDLPPEVVLTALSLPTTDGLQLIEALSQSHPRIPAVLMTEQGSEDLAAEALIRGAASYIPKRRLDRDLERTIPMLLGLSRAVRRNRHLIACWQETSDRFVLDNTSELIPPLIQHFQETLQLLQFADDRARLRVCVALTEAIENAVFHGNLELSSEMRTGDGNLWHEEAARRRARSPYANRTVEVQAALSRREARFIIRDQGPGFNPDALPDPLDPEHLAAIGGRGILLIRTFMDQVAFNERGNEITLVKLAPGTPS